MSPRKLTEDDKQEILQQYRNSEATTSTLAKSFEVSSSTISRFLKNKLSTTEYEDLIQQKRLARTPRGEKSSKKEGSVKKTRTKTTAKKANTKPAAKSKAKVLDNTETEEAKSLDYEPPTGVRRRRRRSAAAKSAAEQVILNLTSVTPEEETPSQVEQPQTVEDTASDKLILDRKTTGKSELLEEAGDDSSQSVAQRLILKGERTEPEEDDDEMDITILKEMLGEDLEDINDEEDEEDEEDWEDEDEVSFPPKSSGLSDIEIRPLSQASLPRTCYLVIDRSAELIVKPLAEFADLGLIPEAEVRQSTLPVFDNHRIAKRFSHRRERVIKVPDGTMLQKTSHHLQDKGITRLLIDGQVYSLSH